MTDDAVMALVFSLLIGLPLLLCLWACCKTRAKPTPIPIPEPTSAQQTGDASDVASGVFSATDTSAPTFTQDMSLDLPPPAVTRQNGGYSLRQQLSSSAGTTLLPMYMDGSDK